MSLSILSIYAPISGMAALAILSATVGFADAATSPNATIEIAARGAMFAAPSQDDGRQAEAARTPVAEGQNAAQVTISRAADLTGRPVYFSRSAKAGSAGLVSFSSRPLPADAVFSVALASPRGVLAPAIATPFTGTLPSLMPVSALALTSGFGMRQHPILGTLRIHSGVDLAASYGSPIVATSDGVVNTAHWSGGYGLLVALDHGGGLQTRYGHMSRVSVVPGQQVRKGEVIGYVGSTGLSTGPHLHYEIRVNGQPVNPAAHLHGR